MRRACVTFKLTSVLRLKIFHVRTLSIKRKPILVLPLFLISYLTLLSSYSLDQISQKFVAHDYTTIENVSDDAPGAVQKKRWDVNVCCVTILELTIENVAKSSHVEKPKH